ncbi:Tyrosinase [Smittium mucronatum]|uniref:Tyrosinase n=1 Tax=Smittium mucronatum TaxID=133383 RepID=A0A1R0H9H9_9FUNG|nr:Tyrosinase [Smittium mucronatum]
MYNNGWFNWFAFIHNQQFPNVHNVAVFLPWHRRFVVEFELVGQRIDSGFAVPYWDATIDFANPAGSPILTPNFIGTNGVQSGNTRCVTNGFQNGWQLINPTRHCLSRNFNGGNGRINPWHSPESVTSIIQTSRTFRDFANGIELGIHADVHNGIGGDMSSGFSPNDFAFMLHHSNIDRLWTQWQNVNPRVNTNAYNGNNRGGSVANLSDRLPVFGETVQSVMRVGFGRNCYSYSGVGANRKRQVAPDDSGQKTLGNFVVANSTIISTLMNVQDMSLATALTPNTLKKYFPSLLAPETTVQDVALPDYVSIKALNYARTVNRNPNAVFGPSGSGRSGRSWRRRIYNGGKAVKPLVSTSIASSLVLTSNKINLSQNVVVNVTVTSPPVGAQQLNLSNGGSDQTINIQKPVIPIPAIQQFFQCASRVGQFP